MTPIAAQAADVVLALPPDPTAARLARRALHEAGLPEDLEHTVGLLTTEAVANAVRHSGLRPDDKILFAARFVDDHIRIEVVDPGPGFDRAVAVHTTGYGLRILNKLTAGWGVERGEAGCRVWFEVDRRAGRRFPRRDD